MCRSGSSCRTIDVSPSADEQKRATALPASVAVCPTAPASRSACATLCQRDCVTRRTRSSGAAGAGSRAGQREEGRYRLLLVVLDPRDQVELGALQQLQHCRHLPLRARRGGQRCRGTRGQRRCGARPTESSRGRPSSPRPTSTPSVAYLRPPASGPRLAPGQRAVGRTSLCAARPGAYPPRRPSDEQRRPARRRPARSASGRGRAAGLGWWQARGRGGGGEGCGRRGRCERTGVAADGRERRCRHARARGE